MHTFMMSMNIASNGTALEPETLLELRRRVRDCSCGPEAALDYHRQLWRLSGFDHYQFTLSRRGGGLPPLDIRVRVAGGRVVSAHQLDAGATPASDALIGTVEDYFQGIEQALYAGAGRVRAQYHSLYGYPLSFSLSERLIGQAEHRRLA